MPSLRLAGSTLARRKAARLLLSRVLQEKRRQAAKANFSTMRHMRSRGVAGLEVTRASTAILLW